jgi:uncharacterized protein
MNKKEIKNKIESEAKKFFAGAYGCHDWTHVERVRTLALHIGKKEKADLFIVEIAALLHDIGRKKEMKQRGGFCHAEKGAEIAGILLDKYGLNSTIKDNILHSIIAHRFRNSYIPSTIEAKVLYDADKLDSIGAIGIARDFLFAGGAGSRTLYTGNERRLARHKKDYSYGKEDSAVLEYEIKLKHIKDKMTTREGKRLAVDRDKFMKEYFKRFWEEVEGRK